MIINPINYGSGGLMSEIIVTAVAGSTLDLLQNGVVLKTYTLASTETQHTFVVKNVGEYTVKSTLGDNTYSSNVLIETVGQYPVTITSKLYLYNYGDECESVTGGWDSRSDFTDVNDSKFVLKPYYVTRSKSNIILSAESNSYKDECFLFAPKNKVSLDKYDKLNINVVSSKISNTTGSNIFIRLCTGTDLNSSIADTNIITSGQTYSGVATVDVTNFNYEIYLLIHTVFWGYTGNGSITFDKVWLE